ncbi:MAG: hypothetical protein IJ410_03415 [Oscillospiraceae bacterium]|nr:hypothetical protein [Oscillospiraceae bacterium]
MQGRRLYERERDSLLDVIEQNSSCFDSKKEYNAKLIQSGSQLEVQLYETWPTHSSGKQKAEKVSRPAQQRLNEKYRQQNCVRIINANFTEADTWLHLTYTQRNKPADEAEAKKIIYNYLRSVQRKYKDTEVKAIYTTKHNGRNCHHHIVINISDRDGLEELWCSRSERDRKRKNPGYIVKRYGRTQARRLQADDYGFTGMALYICGHGKYLRFGKLTKPEEKKTKTLKSRKLTRAFIKKLAEDKGAAKLELLKLFPHCQFNDLDVRQTPYTKGYYLYRRLKVISDSGG